MFFVVQKFISLVQKFPIECGYVRVDAKKSFMRLSYIYSKAPMSLQKSAKQTERSNSYTVVRLKGCKTVKIFDYCKRSSRWSYVSFSC